MSITRKDIAKAAGVSPSTVSRALAGSDLLPRSTIEHIRGVAKEMGYQRNVLAQRLATNKSFQLGFVVPYLSDKKGPFQIRYFSKILDAVVSEADLLGYTVAIFPGINSSGEDVDLSQLVTSKQVDGLILLGLNQQSKIPEQLAEKSIPHVVIGYNSVDDSSVTVNSDPTQAISDLVDSLVDHEYTRMHFVSGVMDYYDAQLQRNALERKINNSPIELVSILEGSYTRISGYEAAKHLEAKLEEKDCIFFANDRMATGYYQYCFENKISVPSYVGVIGSDYDDDASSLFPKLTTIYQPRLEMGKKAVELLIASLEPDREADRCKSVVIEKQLIMGESI